MIAIRRITFVLMCCALLATGTFDVSSPVPRIVVSASASSSEDLKFAFWNMQYGSGVPAAGGSCSVNDAEYATQGQGNAWGTGHLQSYLTQYVRDDPQVVAFGTTEINGAFAMRPSTVLAHLGWAQSTEIGDEALFARHGFAETDWKALTPCGPFPTHALYGKVWTSSARNDWVHVFSTHFMHPDAGTCGSGVQVDDVMQWIAAKATDGRPVVLMGDLNVVVENTDPASYFPDHITRLTAAGYSDAWRTVFPNASTHPGPTATWHNTASNPLPNTDIRDWAPWKRIDYVFARHAAVVDARLFNHDIGDPRNCAAADHAGIVATVRAGSAAPPPQLGSPWSARDIGSVGIPGSATGGGGSLQVSAAGGDIWGTADAFHFVYQSMTGDGSITARVASLGGMHQWAKAGVMVRSTLAADAPHAFMLVSASRGLAFQRRTSAGGASTHTDAGAGTAPSWVRLVRTGTTVTAFRSNDGTTWAEVGRDTVGLGQTVLVGLAVTSHDDTALAHVGFDGVHATTPAPSDPDPSAPPAASSWEHGDVGAPAFAGSAAVDGDRVLVQGSGADIWGGTDAFHFVYQRMSGDGAITARLTSLDAIHAWTKAGVMMRESLDATSPHAMMIATPGTKGLAFQRRPFEASASTHTDGGPGGPPVWLRLERSGAQLIASRSADGVTWIEVGRDTITMSDSLYVGLAVTSHDDSAVARAVFDNVLITQGTGAGWRSADVGAVAASGAAAFDGSTAVVMASGADIWGTADEFHYGYQTVHGDFDLVARVTGVQHAHEWTKAGVMVRASTSAGSVHAFLLATPGITKGVAFQRRLVADGTSVHMDGPSLAPAVWLRLSRRGGTITAAYRQSAAESWVTIAEEWMPDLPHSVLGGLAVTSHLDGALVTASFDNVQIVPVP